MYGRLFNAYICALLQNLRCIKSDLSLLGCWYSLLDGCGLLINEFVLFVHLFIRSFAFYFIVIFFVYSNLIPIVPVFLTIAPIPHSGTVLCLNKIIAVIRLTMLSCEVNLLWTIVIQ